MFKVVKIYLKNSKDLQNQEIYCIRVNFNDELECLKNKVFLRCPKLKNQDSHIYWHDLENDRIKISCDDDLKFFLEESPCHKLVFDFSPSSISDSELSGRKRTCSTFNDDEANESSKKIRKQLQQIDLSSNSSIMDTDDDDDESSGEVSTSVDTSKNSSVSNVSQQFLDAMIPCTSAAAMKEDEKSPNIRIISVDIIKPIEENQVEEEVGQSLDAKTIEIFDETENENQGETLSPAVDTPLISDGKNAEDSTKITSLEKNRIVISDSSDEDETQDNTNNNRRHSDGPSSSAYSFTNVNGNCFESSSTFRGGRHHHEHRFRRNHSWNDGEFRRGHHRGQHRGGYRFQDHLASDLRVLHADNLRQIHQNAQLARESASRACTTAMRNVERARNIAQSNASRFATDMMTNFRAHFQPLFSVNDINQHVFTNMGRR